MPRAGKGYWPGTGDLLVAFIFSFKVPKGPRVFLSLIDHITAGGSRGARGYSTAYVHAPPTFLLDRRIRLVPCMFTTRVPFFLSHHYHHAGFASVLSTVNDPSAITIFYTLIILSHLKVLLKILASVLLKRAHLCTTKYY